MIVIEDQENIHQACRRQGQQEKRKKKVDQVDVSGSLSEVRPNDGIDYHQKQNGPSVVGIAFEEKETQNEIDKDGAQERINGLES